MARSAVSGRVAVSGRSTIPASVNLLADGNMEAAGTASWTAGQSAILSKQTTTPHSGTQCLRIARNGLNNANAIQNSITTIGKTYIIRGYFRGDGTAVPRISNGDVITYATGTSSTSWQYFEVFAIAQYTGIQFISNATIDPNYVEFDDVEVIDQVVTPIRMAVTSRSAT